MSAVKEVYAKGDPFDLPRPIQVVAIANKGAILRIGSNIYPGDLVYAQAWLNVFQKNHPTVSTTCARLTLVGPKESLTQQCCNSAP